MRPVCVNCEVEMYCKKNEANIRINPDYFYSGDMYECPSCGHKIITGFGIGYHIDAPHNEPYVIDFYEKEPRPL